MSRVPKRKLIIKPIHLGEYSQAIVLPAWWLRLNSNPVRLELDLTLDYLVVRPAKENANGSEERDAKK